MATLADKAMAAFLTVHSAVYRRSGGWIGHWFPLAPNNILLHTVGAKTGAPRTSTLSYARDGASFLVVASNGGSNRPPGWYFNVKANPSVEINVGRKRMAATATTIVAGDPDYARRWKLVNDNNSDRYVAYQKRTTRPIPIIALTP